MCVSYVLSNWEVPDTQWAQAASMCATIMARLTMACFIGICDHVACIQSVCCCKLFMGAGAQMSAGSGQGAYITYCWASCVHNLLCGKLGAYCGQGGYIMCGKLDTYCVAICLHTVEQVCRCCLQDDNYDYSRSHIAFLLQNRK